MDCNSIKINGYQIKEVLGHGGMATVYLAIQESFERKVAIKIMSEQLSSDPSFRDRFLQEAKIVSRLIHPNIVTVYDVSVVNNHHYLSMEYIEGVDLKEKLHTISLFHLIKVIKEVALALDYAGRKGYVHRDIKPENIMINNEDGRAVLMDFGIAKAFDTISEMTQTGTAIGTPYYMSPEQAKGKEVDWRSDIYSLGVVFFQVLTGQLPYQGDSAVSVGIMHLTDPIPNLPEYLKEIFQPIIEKLMAKSPEERYQNGEDIIKALNKISDDDLSKINAEYTKEGHRDSGENVNYNVSTPISNSGVTSVRQYTSMGNDQDDGTKIVSISQQNQGGEAAKKWYRSAWFVSLISVVVIALIADVSLSSKNDSIIAKTFSNNKENDEKLNALLESTKIIEQQLINTKKKEAKEALAKQEKEARISDRLAVLLTKATLQEQRLTTNTDTIDELYQTYQLISLLENDHPKVVKGYETIKSTYLEIIEEQILNQELAFATKTLRKKLRAFPGLESASHIISIKDRIDSLNEINTLLTKADKYLADNNLSGTNDENAHVLYNKILKFSPKHKRATKGIINISEKHYQNISQLISKNQYPEALAYIESAEKIHPESSTNFLPLRKKIEQHFKNNKRVQAQKEKIKQLLFNANVQHKIGNLIPPTKNNALSLYQTVLNQEPNNTAAKTAINEIEILLLANVPDQITSKSFIDAQQTIDTAVQHFPKSEAALSQQFELNAAIKKREDSQKPRITKIIVKGLNFADMTQKASHKLKADRTIYLGLEFSNFSKKTTVLQAILYAGSASDKLSTTPVIISQDKGVKYFKISRPVRGFAEGGYFIDFIWKGVKVSSYKFSIEN